MKALTYRNYGGPDVIEVSDLPVPAPRRGEVLIRVKAATVSSGDWRARSLDLPPGFGWIGRAMFGVLRPRQPVLGTEGAGVVHAVGAGVTTFRAGDEVAFFTGASMGAHAEFVVLPEDGRVIPKPASLTMEEAASMFFGGTAAYDFLAVKGGLKSGERVLVIGASGAVGSAAVQVARAMGAHVTGVASGANEAMVRALGADEFIDYRTEDVTRSGRTWDVILNASGNVRFATHGHLLAEGGRILLVLGTARQLLGLDRAPRGDSRKVISGVAGEALVAMRQLGAWAEQGLYWPAIDSVWPLEQAAEAHARVDSGRKRGSVVITFVPAEAARLPLAATG